jgi:hypothetical protein
MSDIETLHELGATKLALLWVVEHLGKQETEFHAGADR